MTDKPIIFSGPMVRALLDGRKSMTRRLAWREIEPGRLPRLPHKLRMLANWISGKTYLPSPWQSVKVGDRLWVRESGWERPERTPQMMRDGANTWERFYYSADIDAGEREMLRGWAFKSRPSIHMRREFSRLTLLVSAVKVERLQEISNDDALAEGALEAAEVPYIGGMTCDQARHAFALLWDSINGPGAWEANPWVAAITFKTVKANIDQLAKEAA